MRSMLPLVLAAAALVGCGPKLVEDEVDGLRRVRGSFRTGGDGQRVLKLDPLEGETAVLLSSESMDGQKTHVVSVEGAEGQLFEAVAEATGDRATTNAGYLSPVATLNWPRHPGDLLEPLRVTLGSVSASKSYADGELEVTALFKEDPDLEAGTLSVVLVFAGGTDADADLAEAVDGALEHWRELYDAIGVELDVSQASWPEGEIDAPVYGTEQAYVDIAESLGGPSLNIVIAPTVGDVDDVLGVAGDIPGPLAATTRTGILVSAVASAGPDGRFSAEETRLLGETMAHEAGHYVGLFHPVETTWDRWDALADTPECAREGRCEDALAEYLMFPYPVCGFSGCTHQAVITDGQAAVMHRYAGMR